MTHIFQVDLSGLIDLLSQHLYSGPQVYLRELLQNGADALRARENLEGRAPGGICVEVGQQQGRPLLVVHDSGVGLTEEEVHRFLATIGSSSKRGGGDFIGRFGIGLLSCFVVSDEIVLRTRSVRGGPAVEWHGKADGTYTVQLLEEDLPFGSQVTLLCKAGSEDYFDPEQVRSLCVRYGDLLPYPIRVGALDGPLEICNAQVAPWARSYASADERDAALRAYGRTLLGAEPFDWFPLSAPSSGLEGVAFVLPRSAQAGSRPTATLYLRDMLLAERDEDLLPPWAFFVHGAFNARTLQPTASRETLQQNAVFRATRHELEVGLRAYLEGLAARDPERMQQLLRLHHLPLRALAADDDAFYRLIALHLAFETSQGRLTLAEILRSGGPLRFVPDLDQFRQVAQIAAARGEVIVNAAYTYDATLLEKLNRVFPEHRAIRVDAGGIAAGLEDLSPAESAEGSRLLAAARHALEDLDCEPRLKRFAPAELPALYVLDREANAARNRQRSREVSDALWSALLDDLTETDSSGARLYLNFDNPTVRQLARLEDGPVLRRVVQTLYLQALLLGHHPLSTHELDLLSGSLAEMIGWGLRAARSLN
ncbi:molecular chaperone HtpG [Deinobacterium chartae]|uniref:Molecular chaperone HtpG n=1 Tax=Deinobacterium chartae TaxID=521158 RepID=A0A841I353_9DEIO|nr:HSP90 family protein [Deinobacterium chartae]MBB6098345.1 molecular chaperone HtpG [Deinobacterium chartae]